MSTKIRLQRHGRKGYAHYTIVVADSRAPRDGKFIERLGSYDPNTDPATIQLNFDRALYWLEVGAQPTDTAHYILKREGVMLMKHLRGGVKKGAFDEAEAQRRFDAWKAEKDAKINSIVSKVAADKRTAAEKRTESEKKVNEEIAKRVAEKKAAAAAAQAEAAAQAAQEAQEAAAEAQAATPDADAAATPEAGKAEETKA